MLAPWSLHAAAPNNQQELDARMAELRQQYAPFLRSLPGKLPAKEATLLNDREWLFRSELEEGEYEPGIPPAPAWHVADLDTSEWKPATVPEWKYPAYHKPPPITADALFASSQVKKDDFRMIYGFGRKPVNLGEYIEASQKWQESATVDQVIGFRLSPRAVSGYFQFHFLDVVYAQWPKSIVSFDHRPKKAYFAMAQANEPVVALPQLAGAKPDKMKLWIANDLPEAYPGSMVRWSVSHAGKMLLSGEQKFDVPASNVIAGETIDLLPVTAKVPSFDLALTLTDAGGKEISRYQRNVRVVPDELLK